MYSFYVNAKAWESLPKDYQAAFEFYAEEAEKNPSFKKIYEPWLKFRSDIMVWHRFAETTYSNFVLNNPIKS